MAKNTYDPGDFAAREAARRKAKGNPNKNVHRKKNGSNYGGGDALAKKAAARETARERHNPPMSRASKITLGVLLGALAAAWIVRAAAFPDSQLLFHLCSALLGAICCFLAYVNYYQRKLKGGFYTVVTILLAVLGALYAVTGLLGIVSLIGG